MLEKRGMIRIFEFQWRNPIRGIRKRIMILDWYAI
jgi:hypothetical protein